jgi:UDP-glucose 4-epimerase
MKNLSVLVTGAGGYVGSETVKALSKVDGVVKIVATDIADMPDFYRDLDVVYVQADIRDGDKMNAIMSEYKIDSVVHLAAALPSKDGLRRDFEYSVNVTGTKTVIDACVKNNVSKIIVSSSGAAYGYHEDNDDFVSEDHALRGNVEFPYCEQKRIVEEMLAQYRIKYPELKQVIFRLSATIGANVKNQISDFFEMPVLFGIKGHDSPFVFIWDKDVVNCIILAITSDKHGVYNLAADGKIPMRELARMMKKPYLPVPEKIFYYALKYLQKLKLVPWGPEQTSFIKYRLVLDNKNLKESFGYVPLKNSREAFKYYLQERS